MVDLTFGPEPGPRLNPLRNDQAYLILMRRRRLYSSIILTLFVVLMMLT